MTTIQKRSQLSENVLVNGLKSHNKSHYEYLYDRYAATLYGAILTIITKPAIAEEVLQDTFIRIWDKIDSYDPDRGRLFTWMVNIARNLSIDKLRSKEMNKEKKTTNLQILVDELEHNNNSEQPVDTIGLRDLLKRLPPEQEFVVEHLYLKGYTQAELADKANIPLGTIKTRLNLGLKKLQILIK